LPAGNLGPRLSSVRVTVGYSAMLVAVVDGARDRASPTARRQWFRPALQFGFAGAEKEVA